jgi:hypothetical protein
MKEGGDGIKDEICRMVKMKNEGGGLTCDEEG